MKNGGIARDSMSRRKHSEQNKPMPWHRIFGMLLSDYLEGSPFSVELEIDLSHHKQLLDIIVVRRRPGKMLTPMPDGLNDLVEHNLISFKSFREPLDDWTLKELTGHYVNYRKQTSPKGELHSEDRYRLYAVCARLPRALLSQVVHQEVQSGVYECIRGTDCIRVVVAGELPLEEKNSLIHLFSAAQERVEYGRKHHRLKSEATSTIVNAVIEQYSQEGLPMIYTRAEIMKDLAKHFLTVEQRLEGLTPDQIMSTLSPEQKQGLLKKLQLKVSPARRATAKTKRKSKS